MTENCPPIASLRPLSAALLLLPPDVLSMPTGGGTAQVEKHWPKQSKSAKHQMYVLKRPNINAV